MFVDRSKLLEVIDLVSLAAEDLLRYWPGGGERNPLEIFSKSDGTKVSSADLLSNQRLVGGLRAVFPDYGLVSEELPVDPNEFGRQRVIIMDPLDGTHAFIDGRSDFSVLVGIVERGVPIVGIMNFPALGLVAWADGGEALINDQVPQVSSAAKIRLASMSLRKCPEVIDPRVLQKPLDSGFALLELARGNLDVVIIRMLTHREWDLVAPMAVLAKAGAVVSDENGQAIKFEKAGVDFKYFVASNGYCHEEALEFVRSELEAEES